jgi:glucosamine-6-phosphate deaminase
MQHEIFPNEDEAGARAAAIIAETLAETPDLCLCLPAGRTPLPLYRELVAAHRAGRMSFATTRIFLVDEYLGVGPQEQGSFVRFLRENLIDHIDVEPSRVHFPDARASDPDAEARRYGDLLESSDLDLVILGVGINGHVGFNEPGSAITSPARVVDLAPETIEKARASFAPGRAVPTRGITIGLENILESKAVLLIACGADKAEPIRQLFTGGRIADWPVAALASHAYLKVLTDRAATPQNFTNG